MEDIIKLEKIPDYGDIMTLKEFIEQVKDGCLIDYDGTGYYATKNRITNLSVYPSDIYKGKINKRWSHIMWFNR